MGNKSSRFEMRIDPHLKQWLSTYADAHGVRDTHIVTDLLVALQEGRLAVRPRLGPSAFPREDVEAGSTPDYPILVAPGLKR